MCTKEKGKKECMETESLDDAYSSLFDTINNTLRENGLDMTNIKGQCYNGASNMSGKHSGLQKRVKDVSPQTLFMHCYAHCVNLVISYF